MCDCTNKCNCDDGGNIVQIIGQKGDKGDNGATPTIVSGSTSSLPSGDPATVDIETVSENVYQFNFGIPIGANGTNGIIGANGWTPVLAVIIDGQRRVQQIIDWTGGSGTKPSTTNQFIGTTGIVSTAAAATDIRGGAGAAATGGVPIGSTIEYGGSTDLNPDPDTGAIYLIEDGRAISRTTYATCFSRLGTTFGAGDGTTTFNIPNSKGRVVFGRDGSNTNFNPIGRTAGVTNGLVNILASNLPVSPPWALSDPGHNHTLSNNTGVLRFTGSGGSNIVNQGGNGWNGLTVAINAALTGVVLNNNNGGGQSLDIKNPYIVKSKIIRVL